MSTLALPEVRPIFGRPVVYRGDSRCPHSARLLGGFTFVNGAQHIVDYCVICGGRTDAIARRDLTAAGVNWQRIPVMADNSEVAA
jgi:hypothetical protein